jgi:hypothetical protein
MNIIEKTKNAMVLNMISKSITAEYGLKPILLKMVHDKEFNGKLALEITFSEGTKKTTFKDPSETKFSKVLNDNMQNLELAIFTADFITKEIKLNGVNKKGEKINF